MERDRRARLAEQQWALQRAGTIRHLATTLATIPDLQQRLDHSPEARLITALHHSHRPPQPPTPLRWAQALHDTLHDDARFQADPKAFTTEQDHKVLEDEAWQQRRAEAAILRRLLGLLAYAANPRNIDLSDHPQLARDITLLVAELNRAPG